MSLNIPAQHASRSRSDPPTMEKGPCAIVCQRGNVRFAFALCLAVALLAPIISNGADRKESGGPWIATAGIIRNGEQPGSGVYLKSGLIITAAHLTAIDATMSVPIAGVVLPAKVLKQGSAEARYWRERKAQRGSQRATHYQCAC